MSPAPDSLASSRGQAGGAAWGWRTMLAMAAAIVVTRLPLLGGGYGSDDDTWRNIVAALHTRAVGRYIPSRIPGFPVYDGLLAVLAPGGWLVTNLASVLAEVAAALLFARLLQRLQVRNALPAWLALAFSAPLWVEASQTIDYAFGLALFLAAFLALMDRRYARAAILLALAVGTRLSYVWVNVGVAAMLWTRRESLRSIGTYAAVHAAAVIVIFLPFILSPEARDLSHHFTKHAAHHATLRTLLPILRVMGIFLFGKWGVLLLAAAAFTWLFDSVRRARRARTPSRGVARSDPSPGLGERGPAPPSARSLEGRAAAMFAAGSAIGVGGFFLLIPYEGAYILALLPIAIIAADRWLPRRWFMALAATMILQVFVSVSAQERRLVPGALFEERTQRRHDVADTREMMAVNPPHPTIYVVGNFMLHRLLVLDPGLERLDAAWEPFYATGVGLRSRSRAVMFAQVMVPAEREEWERQGWTVEDRPYPD